MNETRRQRVVTPWWRRPIGMGLLGLALMVGGWKLSSWVPPPTMAHEQEQAEELARLKRMQGDAQWQEKVDSYARNVQRQPPFEMAGRLVIFAGLAMFIVAGVRMYRAPVKEDSESDLDGDDNYSQVGHDEGTASF